LIVPLRALCIAWGMARTAVSKSFDQISATVPISALGGLRLEFIMTQVKQLPARQYGSPVEREWQIVGLGFRRDRRARHQERVERVRIRIVDIDEVVVGKNRIEVMTIAGNTGTQGTSERVFRPSADAGRGIRCDVGRVDRPERRRQSPPSSVELAARRRVADI